MSAPRLRLGFQVWAQFVSWTELMDAGQEIERLGFDSLWSNDHFLPLVGGPDGVVDGLQGPIFEGWMVLAGWAAGTERIRLGCLVSGAGYRNPALVVKMATALDHMSRGRMTLGLGAGWFEREHQAFGFAFPAVRERLDRLAEAAEIARGLLDRRAVTLAGRWHSAHGAVNAPPPIQARMPLLIGGSGERRTLRIVARFADAWSADGGDPETFARKSAILDDHCRAVGRDPAQIRRTTGQPPALIRPTRGEAVNALARILTGHGATPPVAASIAAASPFVGTPERVAGALRELQSAGVEEVMFDLPMPADGRTLEALGGPIRDLIA
ncbi:MAG TPA: TIGR03560 family F420-dependent LLM class oxidoreductase [Candidatus Limnocylindrales bacterium]|nr:TIGR03560 family F420-dependent LLM class oxidoreductase [Candidatus Limnocylindrales bacterium]